MDKDKFNRLFNSLPWELNSEELAESIELKEKLRPILMGAFFSQFKNLDKIVDED